MTIKQNLYQQCLNIVDQRFKIIQEHITDIQSNLGSESKSSAGDKYETGRAMLQLEREKAGQQLAEINKLKTVLHKIDIDQKSLSVRVGSLVFTSKANYFIAVSLGSLEIENHKCYAISSQTPIGQLLMGKHTGDEINFNGSSFIITKIL
ncbi:MAG: hypothetical protein ABR595_03170 [Psychroflexus sp.]